MHHAQAFFEALGADGHDHEFLHVHSVGCMSAAVEDVHHGDGQLVAVNAAQEAVQRNVQRDRQRRGPQAMETARMALAPRLDLSLVPSAFEHGSLSTA